MGDHHDKMPNEMTEVDIADERIGRNELQGNDQEDIQNQRHSVPDAKTESDDVLESFEKLDKDQRAETDLGKDSRSGDNR